MTRQTLMVLVGLATLLLAAGCNKQDLEPEAPPPTPTARPDAGATETARDVGMPLPLHAKKKGPILVGGCKEACESPKDAFRNYIRALFEVHSDGPAYASYIDTTTLVDNGEELGRRWADMWLMKRFDDRAAEVAAWLARYRTRVGTVADRQAVEDALATGLTFRRIASDEAEFTFIAPPRDGAENSGEWRVKMGKRGLEWLVQAIYD